jgi:UV DNA damage endonuclease
MTHGPPKNFTLGYACINSELEKKKIFTSRTMRLKTLLEKGTPYVRELVHKNLTDLQTIIEWNAEHDVHLFRLSSQMFPFASHPEHGYKLGFADKQLKEIGVYAKKHKIRLTMHPSHFNNLASPSESVIRNTLLDLKHHCEILDRMKLDKNSVLVLHGGGTYGDKAAAIERMRMNLKKLPKPVLKRLVFENDEMNYNIEDLLPLSEEFKIPIVCDFHHDSINPSPKTIDKYFDRVFRVWDVRKIKPKVHVSNSCPGITTSQNVTDRRKHSDHIKFLHKPLQKIKIPIDVMLECKLKEQSIKLLNEMPRSEIFQNPT